jgi:DNA polymerase-3 subunit delta
MELEKLALYATHKKNINVVDVEELISNNSLSALDKFVYACFDRDDSAYSMASPLLEENNHIALVRSIITHTQKLLLVKSYLEEGKSLEGALQEIKPPIFFSYVASFKAQVSLWSEDNLKKLLNDLIYLEIATKTHSNIADTLLKDIILKKFLKK